MAGQEPSRTGAKAMMVVGQRQWHGEVGDLVGQTEDGEGGRGQ